MEKYIGKCLDSLLIPEFYQVEVLVVNDGSKDRSSEIAHSYADRYPESIRVIDKPNGNYGSCINAALPQATGRYIKILDADDTFDTVAFSSFVIKLPGINDDVIITNHVIVTEDETITETTSFDAICKTGVSMSVEDAAGSILGSYIQMHRIAYKRDIFTRFSYHQTEGVSYTDSQWAIVPLAYCSTIHYESLCVYRYLIGREGQTMGGPQLRKYLNNFFTVLSDSVKYYNSYAFSSIGKQQLFKNLTEVHIYVYFKALGTQSADAMSLLCNYDSVLKSECPDVYDAIGQVQWDDIINFKVFDDIRKKSYPPEYRVPLAQRLRLSLAVKLNRLLKK